MPLEELKAETTEFDAPALLAHWAWRVPQHLEPLFLSTFGDWFFRDSDDHVHMFDLVAGELKLQWTAVSTNVTLALRFYRAFEVPTD